MRHFVRLLFPTLAASLMLAAILLTQQLRQLGEVRRYPLGFLFALRRRPRRAQRRSATH
jgi:hypothetical protein